MFDLSRLRPRTPRRLEQLVQLLRPRTLQALEVARRHCRRASWRAVDLLFPPACALCERLVLEAREGPGDVERPLLCTACREAFHYRTPRVCPQCAAPLAPLSRRPNCPECRKRKLPFAGALALGEYRGRLREAVLRTKKSAHESLTMQLGEHLANCVAQQSWAEEVDLVMPLPSHWWRRWSRGTSGPELLAMALARRLQRPLETRLLRCVRRTRKQGMLKPREREQNVRGAFEAPRPHQVARQRILLVDDVMTTGATLREAAQTLRRAGAKCVFVAVLARGTGESAR